MEEVVLGTDYPRSPGIVGTFDNISIPCTELALAVKRFGKTFNKGTDTVWAAGFALLLHRLSGQHSFSFNSGSSESGFSVIDLHIPEYITFEDFISQFEMALSIAKPYIEDGYFPKIEWRFGRCRDSSAELCIGIDNLGHEFFLSAQFRKELFVKARIKEIINQLMYFMNQAIVEPCINTINFSLVTDFAKSIIPDPAMTIGLRTFPSVPESILLQAETIPESVAVEYGGKRYSYQELVAASGRLASLLCTSGIENGDIVAITGVRSFGFVVAMLGVWQAGGVILNIDPSLPEQRQITMATEANTRTLVCVGNTVASAFTNIFQSSITMSPRGELYQDIKSNGIPALPSIALAQPAYVFYTSGSTGKPKGVMGLHRGLSHFLYWQSKEFNICENDRAAQITALSFDVILRDTFMILIAGGTLCIPSVMDVLEAGRIVHWLRDQNISILHVVPSLARMWLNNSPKEVSIPSLRRVFFAGEPLSDALIHDWRSRFSTHAEIINLYGPTETTLAKCFYRIPSVPQPGTQSIGRPIPETQVLIFNAKRQLCGINEPGEIAIRTPYRSLGYINNSEANAKAFTTNLFTKDSTDLIYLTGDSGCYRLDGLLSIFGRLDDQIKIRGIRIEPGEISASLKQHKSVRDAYISTFTDPGGAKAIVGYIVPEIYPENEQVAPYLVELRTFLRARLLEAMIPSAFVLLDSLPLTTNGKINKHALPIPDESTFFRMNVKDPETEVEKSLVEIWRELLEVDILGIDDDFFDLGGHSLLIVQLAQRIKEKLKLKCNMTILFRNRTIRSLARELELNDPENGEEAILALQSQGDGPRLYCICGIHLYQELADELAPEIRTYGIFIPFEMQYLENDPDSPARFVTIEEFAISYARNILSIQPEGPYFLAGVSFGGVVAYEIAHQLSVLGKETGLVVILDSLLPSALRKGILWWILHHIRNIYQEGFRGLLHRAYKRISSIANRNTSQFRKAGLSSVKEDVHTREFRVRRQEFYHAAESVYKVPKYDGQVLLIQAQEKRFQQGDIRDMSFGWGKAASKLEIVDAPGDHIGILEQPHVKKLATLIRDRIDPSRCDQNTSRLEKE